MDFIKKKLFPGVGLIRNRSLYPKLALFLLLFFVFYINAFHEKYPDEFDNILGGLYILHFKFPYSGFFSHHGPVAYFIAAVVAIFSGESFVKFRVVYSAFLFLFSVGTYEYIRRRVGDARSGFYLVLLFILAFSSTYFWIHMLVADSVAAWVFLPVFALLFLKTIYDQRLTFSDLTFLSILTCLALLSSLTFLYVGFFVYLFILYLYFRDNPIKKFHLSLVKPFLILGAPYAAFLIYLLITGSLSDYVYQSIIYNQKYYVYNYTSPDGGSGINPVRFAVIIIHNFYNNFFTLLLQLPDFKFAFPVNVALAVGNVALLIYLLMKRKFALFTFVLSFLIFANARSNPLDSAEKDYQGAVYTVASFFNTIFVLGAFYKELNRNVEFGKKAIYTFLLLLTGIYAFFMVAYLGNRFFFKSFDKYMGKAPLIYDRPEIAPILNSVTTKNDYVWVGPLAFEDMIYLQSKIPTKYHFLIPGMGRSEKIQADFLKEVNSNKPKVVWLDKNYNVLGARPLEYGAFFVKFLDDNYITIDTYREGGEKYVSIPAVTDKFNINTMLYIRKDAVEEVIDNLAENNYLKREAAK